MTKGRSHLHAKIKTIVKYTAKILNIIQNSTTDNFIKPEGEFHYNEYVSK